MTHDVIRTILDAIPDIEAENARLDKEHGTEDGKAVDVFSEASISRAFEESAHEKALEEKLMAFDEESLLKAEAVMYFGRDNDPTCTFQQKLDYVRDHHDSKGMIVHTIMEKMLSLKRYLQKGEAKLRKRGMSIKTI